MILWERFKSFFRKLFRMGQSDDIVDEILDGIGKGLAVIGGAIIGYGLLKLLKGDTYKCPYCGYTKVPNNATNCPNCGGFIKWL